MTGFGGATTRRGDFIITSEIKTVNNRYFKTALKISDGFSSLESKIDAFLRQFIDRGTVNLVLRINRDSEESRYAVNLNAVRYYLKMAVSLHSDGDFSDIPLGTMADYFRLPGTIQDSTPEDDLGQKAWEAVAENLEKSIVALNEMRLREGENMAENLRSYCAQLAEEINRVQELAPTVVVRYREKLTERITGILAEHNLELNPADLVREVALFTDKADISEEIVRFRSHLDQFDAAMKMTDSCGKRLDFLTQELFRETNTIGSKANDSEITKRVVEMKSIIERIREMVQNVE